MSESTLWTWLKGARKTEGSALHIRRVENMTSTGDADVDGVYLGEDFAIELKAGKRPARDTSRIKHHAITEAQCEWHEARYDAGGASACLIQVGEDRYIFPGYDLRLAMESGITLRWLYLHALRVTTPRSAIIYATRQRKTVQ